MLVNMIMAEMNSGRTAHNPTILLEHCESNEQLVLDNTRIQKPETEMEPKELYKENSSAVTTTTIENGDGMNVVGDYEDEMGDKCESELDKLLRRRLQPIQELVYSEQAYVRRLVLVREKYIPVLEDTNAEVPEDLANKWRILWGNWLQLDTWHSAFLEKLDRVATADPDQIPQMFIDSRARLRTIYSKYCENHRKAALIAEQYREYLDELRQRVGDKEDVVSHLMQPVQRIMRYQLPIGEIVKLTDRADLPSKLQWRKALDIMKEIPKDTQLILEAARIDGFPGVITALGNMRIRGELLVATTTKSETRRDSFAPVELRFLERRLFLFDQMLLITEEIKAKKKDSFSQSCYQFKSAINVNKMKFESHWSFADDEDEYALCFAIFDESPGKDGVYVANPSDIEQREQWVIHLRDIQMMQQEFLLALQDPRRFAAGGSSDKRSSTSSGTQPSNKGKCSLSTERCNSEGNWGKKKKQRLPSLSKKHHHSKQLSSDNSPCQSSKQLSVGGYSPSSQPKGSGGKRSSSVERLPVSRPGTSAGSSSRKNSAASATEPDRGGGGGVPGGDTAQGAGVKQDFRKSSSQCKDDTQQATTSCGPTKKKSIFGWFGKNKQKNTDSES